MLGQPGQQRAQRRPVLGVEPGAHRVVVRPRDLADPGQQRVTGRGQVQGVQAPVVGVAPALDQPALVEAVDQGDEPARRRAEQAGQRLLRLPGTGGDRPEQAGLRRSCRPPRSAR